MNTAGIQVGDVVEVDIRGVRFDACVTELPEPPRHIVGIQALKPKCFTWRCCSSKQIRQRVQSKREEF